MNANLSQIVKQSRLNHYPQKQAIGQLMYHAGVTVNMDYEGNGSGAYSTDVVTALRNFFAYTTSNLEYRSNYTNTQWYTKINNDIIANRPMYYAFCDSRGYGCHAVVCDGAQNGNEIHINMGWGG